MICALNLAGCLKTAPTEGAGFQKVVLKPETAVYISKNDTPAAIAIASNNRTCETAKACRK